MSLTIDDVQHVAGLARLGLTDDEAERMRDELSSILEHIEVLQRVDTSAIPPTAQVNSLTNVLRPDEVRASLSREAALANAPLSRDGFIEVKAVLGDVGPEGSTS